MSECFLACNICPDSPKKRETCYLLCTDNNLIQSNNIDSRR